MIYPILLGYSLMLRGCHLWIIGKKFEKDKSMKYAGKGGNGSPDNLGAPDEGQEENPLG